MTKLIELLEESLRIAKAEFNQLTMHNDAELMRLIAEDIKNCAETLGRSYERESDIIIVFAVSYNYLITNQPFNQTLDNFLSVFVPEDSTFKERRRASVLFLDEFETYTDDNTKAVVAFVENFLDECANRRGVRIALNGGEETKPSNTGQAEVETPSYGMWDTSDGQGLARLIDGDKVITYELIDSDGDAVIDFVGNSNAGRQIPQSQSFDSDVAGQEIALGSYRWRDGSLNFSLTPDYNIENPKIYIEGLGDSFSEDGQQIAYSSKLTFVDELEKLSGGEHFIVSANNVYRAEGDAQALGRSTDDNTGEAAGWIEVKGNFNQDNPILFSITKADNSNDGRGNDRFGFTVRM